MFDSLTQRAGVLLDDVLGDLVEDVTFSELVDAVVDDFVSRLARSEAA